MQSHACYKFIVSMRAPYQVAQVPSFRVRSSEGGCVEAKDEVRLARVRTSVCARRPVVCTSRRADAQALIRIFCRARPHTVVAGPLYGDKQSEMVSNQFSSFFGKTADSLSPPPGKTPMVNQLAGARDPRQQLFSSPPRSITALPSPMVPAFAPPSSGGPMPAMPPGVSTPGLPGLRPTLQQPPPPLSGSMWIPVHPLAPHSTQHASLPPPPLPPPPPPRPAADISKAPRPSSPERPPTTVSVVRRAVPAAFHPGPYVPPPWKAVSGGSYRPAGGSDRTENAEMARRMPISGFRGPPAPGRSTPFFGGRTPDEFLVPHSNPFKALENMGPRDPNRSLPPNVFQHPQTRSPPPHQRPALDHPLSLADTADPPNVYGYDALANVPEFPSRWVDPQPLIDFFSLAAPQVSASQERLVATRTKNLGSELGLILAPEGSEWRVLEVLPGGPAAHSCSVYVGNIIKSVNGTSLRGLSAHSVASAVGGTCMCK